MTLHPSSQDFSGGPAPSDTHGPQLADRDFERISAIAYREAGLHLVPSKAAMVRTRLARRLRALKLGSFAEYCAVVEDDANAEELRTMISALTTNVSHFFREEHHFDILRDKLVPGFKDTLRKGGRVRIWSAGCSNGQEPYSIAMTLTDAGITAGDIKILASDIDPVVVAHARAGIYPDSMTSGLTPELQGRHFETVEIPGDPKPGLRAKQNLREMIAFRELNLLRPWPMRGQFDAIFCRNVVIYFDQQTQDSLWHKFANVLAPDAWLFLGHSERVSEPYFPQFLNRGVTSYQRSHERVSSAPAPAQQGATRKESQDGTP